MRLSEEQLRSLEQWAACDLAEAEGRDVQALIDEVRESREKIKELQEQIEYTGEVAFERELGRDD